MAAEDENLREVFDLCSPDNDGFILTNFLADKLAHQFNDQTVDKIQEVLDPERQGRISFEQFCGAVNNLQDTPELAAPPKKLNSQVDCDDESISDPENTYNEYDIEDDVAPIDMESFEAYGESPQKLNTAKSPDSEYFKRHGSFRRSHRRTRSWNHRVGSLPNTPAPQELQHEETSSISSEYDDLSEKVDILQDHVSRLADDKNLQAQYESVKQENLRLTSQVHELEEKMQDLNDREVESARNAQHRLEDLKDKLAREKDLELQVLQSRIEMLSQDNNRLKNEVTQTTIALQETKANAAVVQNKMEGLTQQLVETNEEYRRLSQQFATQHERHDTELGKLREEIAFSRDQLMSLQKEKNDLEEEVVFLRADPNSARLKARVDDLRQENDRLKSTNEELNVQLAHNISDVRSLLCNDDRSIAQELSDATKDDVIEALKKQEQINEQLRNYLDKIILSVLERDPEILEIK